MRAKVLNSRLTTAALVPSHFYFLNISEHAPPRVKMKNAPLREHIISFAEREGFEPSIQV